MAVTPLLSGIYTVWQRWQPLAVCGRLADSTRTAIDQLGRPLWTLLPSPVGMVRDSGTALAPGGWPSSLMRWPRSSPLSQQRRTR
jgi:hypothetical protein